jgi:hypothetical protein
LDSHPPQGTLAATFDPCQDLLDISCLEWAASPMVRYFERQQSDALFIAYVEACPIYCSQIKETRIMDTSAFPIDAEQGLHILAAAYSDSTARVCAQFAFF